MMRFGFLGVLLIANLFVWTLPVPHGLRVSFFDVGEGDSVFIQGPTGIQVLVDGGPAGGGVLRALGGAMPFFDRSLDAVVVSGQSASNMAGLVDVLGRYEVGTFMESGVVLTTKTVEAVEEAVLKSGAARVLARRGMRLNLGASAYVDILYPDSDVSEGNAATGSVVMRVVYGKTSFLLTGDSSQKVEKYLLSLDGSALKSDVFKAGHHGSKSSSAPEFVQAVSPSYVVFSRGCSNKYGFPAPEVVQLFESLNVQQLDTCEDRTVVFVSDGSHLTRTRF